MEHYMTAAIFDGYAIGNCGHKHTSVHTATDCLNRRYRRRRNEFFPPECQVMVVRDGKCKPVC